MKSVLTKIAAVLAAFIGALSVYSGSQVVLFGKVMNYYVIDWLPVYNLIAGLVSVCITAVLIWRGHKAAMPAAIATLLAHGTVMFILQTAYGKVVAAESIKATIVRITFWIIILALLYAQSVKNKTRPAG